jgi:hypothetical protein
VRYFVKYNDDGTLLAIGTGLGGVEITEAEYGEMLEVIREKAALVECVLAGTISYEDIPADWRNEIKLRAAERLEQVADSEISADEALDIIIGGVENDA